MIFFAVEQNEFFIQSFTGNLNLFDLIILIILDLFFIFCMKLFIYFNVFAIKKCYQLFILPLRFLFAEKFRNVAFQLNFVSFYRRILNNLFLTWF